MGWSGKTGTVLIDRTLIAADGGIIPYNYPQQLLEVTEWTAERQVKTAYYPNSGSLNWDDAVPGACFYTGTITVKLVDGIVDLTDNPVVTLTLISAAITLTGMAVLEHVAITTRINGGPAISARYQFHSKCKWHELAGTFDDGNH
jgi:hypothetical protein